MKLYLEYYKLTITKLRNLSFAPEVDLTGQTLPINEFTVDFIKPSNYGKIRTAQFARLMDDQNNVWARYWVTKIQYKASNLITLTAKSTLIWLDEYVMPATAYKSGDKLDALINTCFEAARAHVPAQDAYCIVDPSIEDIVLDGFCPEQTARERLQSMLMAAGAYLKTWNDTEVRALPLPDFDNWHETNGLLVPSNKVFWKPQESDPNDYSKIKVKYYSVADYDTGGEQVKAADGTTYWVTSGWRTTTNSYASSSRELEISGNMLINYAASQSLQPMIRGCFINYKQNVEADVINNGDVWPGDLVYFQYSEDAKQIAKGYIRSTDFSFGHQARSKLNVYPSEIIDSVRLILNWTYNERIVYTETLLYPAYTTYDITLPNKQVLTNGHLYVYAPVLRDYVGELDNQEQTIVVDCDPISDTNLITGEITTDFTPHHITVVVPPKRQSYTEGDSVDYNGIVVKVYNASNQIIDTYSTPNGIIPYDDLVKNTSAVGIESNSGNVGWNVNSYTVLRDSFPVTVYAVRTLSGVPYFLASGPMVNMSGTEMVITDDRAELDGNTLIVGE